MLVNTRNTNPWEELNDINVLTTNYNFQNVGVNSGCRECIWGRRLLTVMEQFTTFLTWELRSAALLLLPGCFADWLSNYVITQWKSIVICKAEYRTLFAILVRIWHTKLKCDPNISNFGSNAWTLVFLLPGVLLAAMSVLCGERAS